MNLQVILSTEENHDTMEIENTVKKKEIFRKSKSADQIREFFKTTNALCTTNQTT